MPQSYTNTNRFSTAYNTPHKNVHNIKSTHTPSVCRRIASRTPETAQSSRESREAPKRIEHFENDCRAQANLIAPRYRFELFLGRTIYACIYASYISPNWKRCVTKTGASSLAAGKWWVNQFAKIIACISIKRKLLCSNTNLTSFSF